MANIKSAIKRVDTNERNRVQNQGVRTDMRSSIKQVETFVNNNDVDNAKSALEKASHKIDKAVQKGIIHKNKGNRQKSHLAKRVNGLGA